MGAVGKMSDSLGVNQSKPVEATEMDDLTGDVVAFFDQHEAVYLPHAPGVEPLLVGAAGTGIARVSWGASGVRGGVRYPLAPPYFPARYLRRRNAVKYGSVRTEPSRPTLPPHSLIPQPMSG